MTLEKIKESKDNIRPIQKKPNKTWHYDIIIRQNRNKVKKQSKTKSSFYESQRKSEN
jgi:hypothetical protein